MATERTKTTNPNLTPQNGGTAGATAATNLAQTFRISEELLARAPQTKGEIQKLFESDWAQKKIAGALPKHLTPERIQKLAVSVIARTPELMRCNLRSLVEGVATLADLGLELGGGLGYAYLVPYGAQAQAIIGWRGLIELARRSGKLKEVRTRVVYSKDVFELTYGDEEKLVHRVRDLNDRGELVAVYCIAEFKDGTRHLELMSKAEIEKVRAKSPTGRSAKSPWSTDYEEMARKTVVRRSSKYWPLSAEDFGRSAAEVESEDNGEMIDAVSAAVSRGVSAPSAPSSIVDAGVDAISDAEIVDPVTGEVSSSSSPKPIDPVDAFLERVAKCETRLGLDELLEESEKLVPNGDPRRAVIHAAISKRRGEVTLDA